MPTAPLPIRFGTDAEYLVLTVLGQEAPGAEDRDTWLNTEADLRVGAFTGTVRAAVRSADFAALTEGLRQLPERAAGAAELSSTDGWLWLTIAVDGLGRATMTGELSDPSADGNALRFTLPVLGRVDLEPILAALDDVLVAFPA